MTAIDPFDLSHTPLTWQADGVLRRLLCDPTTATVLLRRRPASHRDPRPVTDTGMSYGILLVPPVMSPAEWIADQEAKNALRQPPGSTWDTQTAGAS